MCIHTRKLAGAFVCLDENNDGCLILRPFLYLSFLPFFFAHLTSATFDNRIEQKNYDLFNPNIPYHTKVNTYK